MALEYVTPPVMGRDEALKIANGRAADCVVACLCAICYRLDNKSEGHQITVPKGSQTGCAAPYRAAVGERKELR